MRIWRRGRAVRTAAALVGAATAQAKSQTLRYTFHNPAYISDNLCSSSAEPVALAGDFTVTLTTTALANGAYVVRSSTVAHNLKGTGLISMVPYNGQDTENSYQYNAVPPYPSSFSDVHWTKLVPKSSKIPAMWLVVVVREVVLADGTPIPTIDRSYLACHQPTSHCDEDDRDDCSGSSSSSSSSLVLGEQRQLLT